MNLFIRIGVAIIFGVLCGKAMNKLKVPSVAGYIIAGLIVGTSGFNLISETTLTQLSFISDFALCVIAFNIGSELELSIIKQLGKSIFIIAICEALGAFTLVTGLSYLLTHDPAISLILGSVSAATAPAATVMVLREYNAKGPLTSTLMGVVAVDDAICLMIYAMAASIAKVFVNHDVITLNKVLILPLEEIIVSILVGMAIGIGLTFLLRISEKDAEYLPFIIGTLLFLDGIASYFQLSPLLTAMSLGIMVANLSSKKLKAFSVLDHFSPPIIAAFFILAGARLNIAFVPQIGLLGIGYFLFRVVGKVAGASLGATLSHAPLAVKKYIGFGLLSQVGVAVGLAITVGREFPGTDLGPKVVTILLATTIATEIVGPMMTKFAITKADETHI
jgi:Kef-type K+ transport system membrane component KefB